MAPKLNKEGLCKALIIDYAVFPAVSPPATKHIAPRFNVTSIPGLLLIEFGLQDFVPHAFLELRIALEFRNTLFR